MKFTTNPKRLEEVMELGTGAVEIKSGYGLSVEDELKMLRVIGRLQQDYPVAIKATFLGAHVSLEYKQNQQGYIDLIVNEMIPKIAAENLPNTSMFSVKPAIFSAEQTDAILKAGIAHGLIPKIHVNQFNAIGGVGVGVKNKALSVDHLEVVTPEDIEILKIGGRCRSRYRLAPIS